MFPAEFSCSQTSQRDSNVHRLVNNFRDVDMPGNVWFEIIHVPPDLDLANESKTH